MNKLPKLYVLSIYISLLFFLYSCILGINKPKWDVPPIAMPTRMVNHADFSIQEKWRYSDKLIQYRDNSVFIAIDGLLIFVDFDLDELTRRMVALSGDTGSIIWETEPLAYPEEFLVSDREKIYLALSKKIIAYDIATGKVLWETEENLPDRTQYRMIAEGNSLILYSAEDINEDATKKTIRTFNTQNGVLENIVEETTLKDASFILKTNDFEYWTNRSAVWLVNRETNQQQWSIPINEALQYEPLLINNTFIFASGIFSDVFALDNLTGRQVWKYNNKIVSNMSLDSNTIYAIREDASIVAIDAFSGEEIEQINMKPNYTENQGSRSLPYLITTNSDMIFVYFGDSQEIIAFSK
jgi:outer membrane protein assembly factor BamB